jgi:streptogramin lyase
MKSLVTHPWLRRVSDYHSGGVSAAERAAVEAHLAECAECQRALAAYQRFYILAHSPLRLGDSEAAAFAEYRPEGGLAILEETVITSDSDRNTWSTTTTRLGRPRAALTTFGAIAAVLVLALLAASLFAYFGSPHQGPAGKPTPTPAALRITEYPLPTANSWPTGITRGPDGNLWFTEYDGTHIGRMTQTGRVTEFPLPTANSAPLGIASGPDGNLWFTETDAKQIGRITVTGAITEYPVPAPNSNPGGMTAGPDGALWFTEANTYGNCWIGRITVAGAITEFPLPTFDAPWDITAGPDGALWFTEGTGIGRITPSGQVRHFTLFPSQPTNTAGITVGPDGALWFTEAATHKIGRITAAGQITEYLLPTGGAPQDITRGPDGNLWFTESVGNQIGRITSTGEIAEFPIPTSGSLPKAITSGPDGALWFTEAGKNKIGRIAP